MNQRKRKISPHSFRHAKAHQILDKIGIFKEINSEKIPNVHPLIILVFEINLGDTKDHNLKIEFKDPDGDNVKEPINFADIKVDSDDINLGDLKSVIRYSSFILFSLVMCLIIKKRLYIENKRIHINNIIKYNFKKLIFILFILLIIVFLTQILEVLIKLL